MSRNSSVRIIGPIAKRSTCITITIALTIKKHIESIKNGRYYNLKRMNSNRFPEISQIALCHLQSKNNIIVRFKIVIAARVLLRSQTQKCHNNLTRSKAQLFSIEAVKLLKVNKFRAMNSISEWRTLIVLRKESSRIK